MPCYNPLKGIQDPDGKVRIRRSVPATWPGQITVPCGQCIGCRLRRNRDWAVRIYHESKQHDRNCFLTLTYDDDHLVDDELHLEHWQTFIKRLRSKLSPNRIRYFHAGEYGDLWGRPHYHAAIFGEDFFETRRPAGKSRRGFETWHSDIIDSCWPGGIARIQDLTMDAALYIAKYTLKKITGPKARTHYHGRQPEYATMSLKPGLGAGWQARYQDETYRDDFIVIKGKRYAPPKYYDNQYELSGGDIETIKAARQRRAARYDNDSLKRLSVKETVLRAKLRIPKEPRTKLNCAAGPKIEGVTASSQQEYTPAPQ